MNLEDLLITGLSFITMKPCPERPLYVLFFFFRVLEEELESIIKHSIINEFSNPTVLLKSRLACLV